MFFYILFSKPMAAEMSSVNNVFVVGPSVQAFLYCHYKPFVAALQAFCSRATRLLYRHLHFVLPHHLMGIHFKNSVFLLYVVPTRTPR